MHGFHLQTFVEYGNSPALAVDFARHLVRTMPRQLVIFLAERDGLPIAVAVTSCMAVIGDLLSCIQTGTSKPAITRASTTACRKGDAV